MYVPKENETWEIGKWTMVNPNTTPLSVSEIDDAIDYLRREEFPKPTDCPGPICPDYCEACLRGRCHVAEMLCKNLTHIEYKILPSIN